LAAFRHAAFKKYGAVEFDVKLTKDKKTILFHDEFFGRTVDKPGKIGHYLMSELLHLDAGTWHENDLFVNEPLCPFAACLSFCKKNNLWMNVEIKPEKDSTELAEETGRVVALETREAFKAEIEACIQAESNGQAQLASELFHELPLFSSFNFDALLAAKHAAPDLPRAFLIKDLSVTTDWREKCAELGAVAVHTNHENLSAEQAAEIKRLGYSLMCYTVNSLEDYWRLLSYGVNSICTDDLSLFNELSITTLELKQEKLRFREGPKAERHDSFSPSYSLLLETRQRSLSSAAALFTISGQTNTLPASVFADTRARASSGAALNKMVSMMGLEEEGTSNTAAVTTSDSIDSNNMGVGMGMGMDGMKRGLKGSQSAVSLASIATSTISTSSAVPVLESVVPSIVTSSPPPIKAAAGAA
jgi:glycerophosphoryl diester phosphodiesterase